MRHRTLSDVRVALVILLVAPAAGCASFRPEPIDAVPFRARVQTQTQRGVTVRTTVLSREEARRVFGVDLEEKGIQPVWFDIQNDSDVYWGLLLTSTDPNYFSAREAAYKSHLRWRGASNRRIDDHFEAYGLNPDLPARSRNQGFLFTNLKLGTKEVRLKMFTTGESQTYEFYVPVPGFQADYHEVDWEALQSQSFEDHQDPASLASALEGLPCCTQRSDGTGKGDPVNLVLIGSTEDVANALIRAGWDETEKLTLGSAWRTFKAFWGGEYKYSPMSSLYLYGRGQDAGFQKARDTIHERNHLRLWLSPLKYRGEHVWVGTITRDIGVYFTTRAWNLTTHAIDPDVDEARGYLSEDFANAQSLARFGFVDGVGAAAKEDPHRNLMDAPWWTDGRRIVMEVSKEPVSLEEVQFFEWDWEWTSAQSTKQGAD